VADQPCGACGGVLVPPAVTVDVGIPHGTDYVCLTCKRVYRWVGNPPKLTSLASVDRSDDDHSPVAKQTA